MRLLNLSHCHAAVGGGGVGSWMKKFLSFFRLLELFTKYISCKKFKNQEEFGATHFTRTPFTENTGLLGSCGNSIF